MAGFEAELDRLHALDAGVVALSVDGEEEARGTVERLGLRFPVLWGIDPAATAERFGAYTHPKGFVQPTGFLLRRGEIQQSTYSSGALGRLRPDEVIQWIEYVRSKEG